VTAYEDAVKKSWVFEELQVVRNVQPSFKWGLFGGMTYSGLSLLFTRGKEPWTLSWSKKDHEYT
jgi:electron-transferring-flavoprotein dehydrogenase